ncbi:MAG TPA: AAA family ATPase [Patescibacteria group bacterium]|nr:AAA family ATPase [Patescibacteria group bacterium]
MNVSATGPAGEPTRPMVAGRPTNGTDALAEPAWVRDEFAALTAPRDPPSPEDAAHEAESLAGLEAGAAETRARHDAQLAGLGPASRAAHEAACPLCIARALPVPEPAGPSWRTLADIPDTAPGPLVLGMLEPDGPTLAYAAPAVGKGTTAAHVVCELQKLGLRAAIYDAERRPREYARRVSGLGGDRSRVVYIDPGDLGPKRAGAPLWDKVPAIGRIVKAAGADLLIVDSILPAVGLAEDRLRSDAAVPYMCVAALDSLGIPSLTFGHPPKGQPEGEPFGSFAWVAAFRLTWLGVRAEGDGHRIRWRPKKRNERGHIGGIVLTVTYGDDGRPCAVERADDEEGTRDWLLAALVHGPRSVAELAEELLAEYEDAAPGELDRAKERLGAALNRMRKQGWVERLGTSGRGVRWQLALRENRP